MAESNSVPSSSQMESIPPGFETQFNTVCNIEETQSEANTGIPHQPFRTTFPHGSLFAAAGDWEHDAADSAGGVSQSSAGNGPAQVNIFQGNSLFGGGGGDDDDDDDDDESEAIPETPPVIPAKNSHSAAGMTEGPCFTSPAHGPEAEQGHYQATQVSPFPEEDGNNYFDSHDTLPPYPFPNPTLDPNLGTQVPQPQSPQHYYGSIEDNEDYPCPDSLYGGSQRENFRSPSRSESPDFENEYYGHQKYDLREREKGPMTTHLDHDESGNYDPAEEGKRAKKPDLDELKSRKRRSGQLVQGDLDEKGQPRQKKPKPFSLPYARFIGASFVCTIRLKSEAGKELLGRYRGQDNWPDQAWNFLSDEHISRNNALGHENEVEDDEDEDQSSPRRRKLLRPRKRHIRYDSPGSDDGLPVIADPKGERDNLRHDPAARGCTRCRIEGRICSLRKTGNTWPCQHCIDNTEDDDFVHCDLIVTPEKLTKCENCLDGDKQCSYEDHDTDHSLSCHQCQEAGLKCIAGPDMDSLPKRITYTPPPGVKYIPYRTFISCTACRQVKKACSLKSKSDQPPCRACAKSGIACAFEKIIPTNAGKKKAVTVEVGDSSTETSSSGDTPTRASSPVDPAHDSISGSGPVRIFSASGGPTRTSSSSGPVIRNKAPAQPPLPKKNPRDSGIAGMDHQLNRKTSEGSSSTTRTNAVSITTFRSGVATASGARKQAETCRMATPRRRDSVRRINPVSTMSRRPSTMEKEYDPPAADAPAAYHLPPSTDVECRRMKDSKGRRGFYREIVTALPHPISFKTRPPESSEPALCRFCSDPRFMLYGLSRRKVGVIVWDSGRGYTEIQGGHREKDVQPAAMCRDCVMSRVDIISCVDHDVESIVPAYMGKEEWDSCCVEQFHRLNERRFRKDDLWCSVCPQPAVWVCCADQDADDEGDEDEDEDDEDDEEGLGTLARPGAREGCGLFFCGQCKENWEMCGKDFQELLENKLATEKGVAECRADAAFLLEDGLLMKNVSAALAHSI